MALFIVGVSERVARGSGGPGAAPIPLEQHPRLRVRPGWHGLSIDVWGAAQRAGPAGRLEATLHRVRPAAVAVLGIQADLRAVLDLTELGPHLSLHVPPILQLLASEGGPARRRFLDTLSSRARGLPLAGEGLVPARRCHPLLVALMSWSGPMHAPVLFVHAPADVLEGSAASATLGVLSCFTAEVEASQGAVIDWSA